VRTNGYWVCVVFPHTFWHSWWTWRFSIPSRTCCTSVREYCLQ